MSDTPLARCVDQISPADGGWQAPAPDNWTQGRTAFGGYSSAMLLAAVNRQAQNLPPLRSALINFTGPVSGTQQISVETLRQGRNVTTIAARGEVDGKVAITGTFSFGSAQQNDITQACPAPSAPAPKDAEPLIPEQFAAMAPGFHRNFDIRLIDGVRPMMGGDRGYIRCWARHNDPASRTGEVSLLCMANILPPAVLSMHKSFSANSSMTWICNFLGENAQTKDGWWHVESALSAAQNGYSSQVMRVWNSDGDLVVEGMQSVLVFA